MTWRPKDWPICPCDACTRKEEDEYGLYCDLTCGKNTDWLWREEGADAMLRAIIKETDELWSAPDLPVFIAHVKESLGA